MAKNIIILNGSPRKNGNTSALIKAFTEGAESAGHKVTTFFLDGMNIHGCKGCLGGGKNPDSPCVQKDDMDKIYPVYNEADIVVLASPLYFWTLSGQLRTAFDRMFAVAECTPDYSYQKKGAILLMAAGDNSFEEAIFYYENLLQHIQWDNLGKVLAGGVNQVGDIAGNPALDDAKKLGASLS